MPSDPPVGPIPPEPASPEELESVPSWGRWRKRLAWLITAGLLLGWVLTWAPDSPLRPVLAERDNISGAAVHVGGVACGQIQEGSGFMAEPGLVLTNAHVVAGVEQIDVSTPDGSTVPGRLVGFDPGRDIAAIEVSGSAASPVSLASVVAVASDVGDVAIFDADHGLEFEPFVVNRRIWASGNDIYADPAENRLVLEIRSLLAAGDSGAALVDVDGEVLGMVFAVARGQQDRGYALDRVEIAEFLAEIDREPVPTPPCR